ncbi:MAG: hypothetical protein LPJ92_03310 [Rhodobacterales bacterium]|nr:hypothetical protein [Rhodobacterales bacterium]MDX5389337.1 hypothetical protein [Rhodobacterales bacterium]MDX5489034.1 hypothetical protein [Rhodobacterales bacterium]
MDEKTEILRARDFWGALALMGLSLFFLWRTLDIPLWGENRAGVSSAAWYNSAAIVPFGIFTGLLALSFVLLITAIRAGGARRAMSAAGIGWNADEALRFTTICIILFFYIVGLVPRVDFILSSGLLITALTFGFHKGYRVRMMQSACAVALAGLYALISHLPQSDWAAHDDDWLTLSIWVLLTGLMLRQAKGDRVLKMVPVIALVAPVLLVCAMAFGFRQNVPNRGGLIFKQIEIQYFVTIRPLWRS